MPHTIASRFIILAICLAVMLTTFAFGTVHSWSIGLFHAGAGFIVVAWAADAWRTKRLRVSRNILLWPLVGLFVLGLAQLLPLGGEGSGGNSLSVAAVRSLSLDPYTTRFVLIQLFALIVYFAAALAFIDSPKRLRTVVHTIIVFGFALAVFGMIQSAVSPESIMGLRKTTQSLAYGPFINRHHFAGYMELALALPLGLIFSGAIERQRMPLYGFAAALMGMALILTNSRGGMISLAAEIMFLVILAGVVRRTQRQREARGQELNRTLIRDVAWRAGLGFVLVLALFLGVIFFGGEEALSRLVGSVNAEDPTTGRLHFWRGTLGIIRDYPLIGTGLGSFSVAYPRYDTSSGLYRLEQAHNDYLQLLSDAGIIGALCGLFFVIMLFRLGFRCMQSESDFRRGVALGGLSGCFAVLIHSFFDFTLHTTANALLFLLIAALATINGRVEQVSSHQSRRRRRRRSSSKSSAPLPTEVLHEGSHETKPVISPG